MVQEGLDDPNDLFNDSVLEWLSLTCPTGASDSYLWPTDFLNVFYDHTRLLCLQEGGKSPSRRWCARYRRTYRCQVSEIRPAIPPALRWPARSYYGVGTIYNLVWQWEGNLTYLDSSKTPAPSIVSPAALHSKFEFKPPPPALPTPGAKFKGTLTAGHRPKFKPSWLKSYSWIVLLTLLYITLL